MKDNHIQASLFLADRFIKDDPGFFKDFVVAGPFIEDHTMDHKLLLNLNYAEQKQEICAEADLFDQEYGRRPILFHRPAAATIRTPSGQRRHAACAPLYSG